MGVHYIEFSGGHLPVTTSDEQVAER